MLPSSWCFLISFILPFTRLSNFYVALPFYFFCEVSFPLSSYRRSFDWSQNLSKFEIETLFVNCFRWHHRKNTLFCLKCTHTCACNVAKFFTSSNITKKNCFSKNLLSIYSSACKKRIFLKNFSHVTQAEQFSTRTLSVSRLLPYQARNYQLNISYYIKKLFISCFVSHYLSIRIDNEKNSFIVTI